MIENEDRKYQIFEISKIKEKKFSKLFEKISSLEDPRAACVKKIKKFKNKANSHSKTVTGVYVDASCPGATKSVRRLALYVAIAHLGAILEEDYIENLLMGEI